MNRILFKHILAQLLVTDKNIFFKIHKRNFI